MTIRLALFATLLFAAPAFAQDVPVNPRVKQTNIARTICVSGWTRGVRPSSSVTTRIKLQMLEARGEPPENRVLYQLDHIVPLELGGALLDPRNLELQPWPEAHEKDVLGNCLHRMVCAGRLRLGLAQRMMFLDWHQAAPWCGHEEMQP